jgi:heme/copper-type cytochrome/quinol oxidase subunit 2
MKIKKHSKYIIGAAGVFLPSVALAQSVDSGLQAISGQFTHGGLTGATSVQDLIVRIIQLMLLFAGIIAVVFIIYGGYLYITSAGNEESAEKGKNTMVNAIIGIVIIVLSYVIVNVIVNLAGNGVL